MSRLFPSSFLPSAPPSARVSGYRLRVLAAIMLVVSAVTAIALYVSDRNLGATIERELQRDFEVELENLHDAQAIRDAVLVERCRELVRKPRIHAALEDDALDLLYPSAEDELRDIMAGDADDAASGPPAAVLRAKFYRFLDRAGRVIVPASTTRIGALPPEVQDRLTLPRLTNAQQVGYLPGGDGAMTEVIATPIISSETGEVIAALVLGFKALRAGADARMQSGIWVNGRLVPATATADRSVTDLLATVLPADRAAAAEGRREISGGDSPRLVFYQRLNPGSLYPPAYEVSVFSLEPFAIRHAQLRFRFLAVGALLLAGAFLVSQLLAKRLTAPVERLAADSERSARFSADASHQLKTPVAVLRAGLEELLARDNLTAEECDAIAALIHQTYRLSSLIEDLLLLSRLDSGRLKLSLASVDLAHLLAAALDDLSATPDAMELEVETEVPAVLQVAGEQRYTAIILQNLLENARKYNRPGGRIRIAAQVEGEAVFLSVANTGRPIAPAAQRHIFERFHRGSIGENVPGYGLGLNLARELARLHEGDLRLVRSDAAWTEFEVRFKVAHPLAVPA